MSEKIKLTEKAPEIKSKNSGFRKQITIFPKSSGSLSDRFLFLQRAIGNQAVSRLLQTKLKISQPGDKYEQEADRVADTVLRMPTPEASGITEEKEGPVSAKPQVESITPLIQRQTAEEKKEEEEAQLVQTKGGPGQTVPSNLQSRLNTNKGSGERLPSLFRSLMEPAFGSDFSQVRVHRGAEAANMNQQLGDQAFTLGNDIYFNEGKYNTETSAGKHLLAHELTHVVQQGAVVQRAVEKTSLEGSLTDEQITAALEWYEKRKAQYPSEVAKRIQEKVSAKTDGIIGPKTVKAIADWQRVKRMTVDGKAGFSTLTEMFGTDIRPEVTTGGAPRVKEPTGGTTKPPTTVPEPGKTAMIKALSEEKEDILLESIFSYLRRYVLFPDPEAPIHIAEPAPEKIEIQGLSEEEKTIVKPPPKKSQYIKKKKPGFVTTMPHGKLNPDLLKRVDEMAQYALDNDLVTNNITYNDGMRTPQTAHKWSTAWAILTNRVTLKTLQELKNSKGEAGKDEDGNLWYEAGWGIKEAKAKAATYRESVSIACEGYKKGDKKNRPPNNPDSPGTSPHCDGKAIDATFYWKIGAKVKDLDKLNNLKANITKAFKDPKVLRTKLALVDDFVKRGSYSLFAEKIVEKFGLWRPQLHNIETEDWHYQLK